MRTPASVCAAVAVSFLIASCGGGGGGGGGGGAQNSEPVALGDEVTLSEDVAGAITPLANDYDPDGDALSIASVTTPSHGAVSIQGNSILYTPHADSYGPDGFTYTVSDGRGGTAAAAVSVTVTPVNDPPVAAADTLSNPEDTPTGLDLIANDTDVDGDSLSLVSVSAPAHGSAVITSSASIRYDPDEQYCGADAFTYSVSDGHGGETVGNVTVGVDCVNDPPISVPDPVFTSMNTPVEISVLANDTDVEGGGITVVSAGTPGHGGALLVGGSAVEYTPAAGYYGVDTFTYTSADSQGAQSIGKVFVTVEGPPGNLLFAKRAAVSSVGKGVAVFSGMNAVATGSFCGPSATFGEGEAGETTLTTYSATTCNAFVARFHPDGTLTWAKRAGGKGDPRNRPDFGTGVAALSDGTATVVGSFWNTATFGEGEANETVLYSSGGSDAFIARYTPDGALAWAKNIGDYEEVVTDAAVAHLSDGSAVMAGEYYGDLYLARYGNDGERIWSLVDGRNFGSDCGGLAIAVMADDSIIVGGHFSQMAGFSGTVLTSLPYPEGGYYGAGFIAKYDSAGKLLWAKTLGERVNGLSVTSTGDILATGSFEITMDFAGASLTSYGGMDIFTAKLDTGGSLKWVRQAGGATEVSSGSSESGNSVTALADGGSLVTGSFNGTAVFGKGEAGEVTMTSATSANSPEAFVARYDASGNLVWARSVYGPGLVQADRGSSVAATPDGSCFVTGQVSTYAAPFGDQSVIFGRGEPNETSFSTGGESATFLARFSP